MPQGEVFFIENILVVVLVVVVVIFVVVIVGNIQLVNVTFTRLTSVLCTTTTCMGLGLSLRDPVLRATTSTMWSATIS